MIQAVSLSKTYELKIKDKGFRHHTEKKEAVKNLDLNIEKGKITGILGVNGAGKTTTIKMLATLLAPTSGTIKLDDLDYCEKNLRRIKEKINLISGGERSLYWRLTGRENLEYFASLYGIGNARVRIQECLRIVGLLDNADQLVETYSKGMKQRLQIARGIINDPSYLFMDEPTLGLDIAIAQNLRQYIRQLSKQENMAVILSTHYMKEAEELCDYVYVIDHGEKAAEGTIDQLKQKFTESYEYTLETSDADKLVTMLPQLNCAFSQNKNIVSLKSKANIVPQLFALAEDNHIRINGFHQQEASLEDCIMQIISKEKAS